jgi:hypothetical protein
MPKVIQPSETRYYVLATNKRATLTRASVYNPKSNRASTLRMDRYVVSPRTVADYIGEAPIDPKKNNFICDEEQMKKSTIVIDGQIFKTEKDVIAWFRQKYVIVNGQIVKI